ncbi:unnamed protein product [Tuber aestivum]|uniref:Methyltransferase type 11 domain-containing protein n=1 Tax=Tuber aestivum TaxID=59557 RepID=A0A292PW87_9PEZI|nr:unnamed protein product [Tuber aestivum]
MRRCLESKSLPNVTVLDGMAESIPLPDASVEVVFVAQAFHWFATVPALREIARVLKPAGWLALVWNVEDYSQTCGYAVGTGWEARLRELNWRVAGEDGVVRYKDYLWQRVSEEEGEVKRGLFGGLQEWKEEWRVWIGAEELWSRIETLSHFANLEPEEGVKAVKGEFDEIMKGVRGQERDGEGRVEVSGIVHAAWARKL